MGKRELGPEKTGFGEARERREGGGTRPNWKTATGSQGLEDAARTKRHRGLDGPDKRDLWPSEDAGKDRQDSAGLGSPEHQSPRT